MLEQATNNYKETLTQLVKKLIDSEDQDGQRKDLISQAILNCPREDLFDEFYWAMMEVIGELSKVSVAEAPDTYKKKILAIQKDFIYGFSVIRYFPLLLQNKPLLDLLGQFIKEGFDPNYFSQYKRLRTELSSKFNDSEKRTIGQKIDELCGQWPIIKVIVQTKMAKEALKGGNTQANCNCPQSANSDNVGSHHQSNPLVAAREVGNAPSNRNRFYQSANEDNSKSPNHSNPAQKCTLL